MATFDGAHVSELAIRQAASVRLKPPTYGLAFEGGGPVLWEILDHPFPFAFVLQAGPVFVCFIWVGRWVGRLSLGWRRRAGLFWRRGLRRQAGSKLKQAVQIPSHHCDLVEGII